MRTDLGELAAIPAIKGLDEAIAMLKTSTTQAKGFRYEIEGAAWLVRHDHVVEELTKRVSVFLDGATQVTKTDIDVVVKEGTTLIYYQFKRSVDALGYGEKGLKSTKAWVAKAMKDLDTPDYSRIKYALPNGVSVFGGVDNVVVRIPHLD